MPVEFKTESAEQSEARAKVTHRSAVSAQSADLPCIQHVVGKLPEALDALGAALAKNIPHLFVWNGRLVCLHRMSSVSLGSGAIKRHEGAVTLVPVDAHHLSELAARAAVHLRWDARSGDYRPTDVPMKVVQAYLARGVFPEHRQLSGIVESPTLTTDGRALTTPGYDAGSGLYVAYDPAEMPGWKPLSPSPSLDEAKHAAQLLMGLLGGFPFVGPADASAAVAGIISACVRRSLPAAPLLGISAPTPGSGKTFLAEVIGVLVSGRRPPVMSLGHDDAEDEKRLGGVLLAGDQMIVLDNVSRALNSDLLNQACTQPYLRLRPLGGSTMVSCSTAAQLVATGNGLSIVGDLKRRTVLVRLDARVERPELREFNFDPLTRAAAERGRLLRAALTIPLAYIAAGSPDVGLSPYGSFGDWDRLVRRPLKWAGLEDPLGGAEVLRDHDPDLEAARALLSSWLDAFGSNVVGAAEVVRAATETGPMTCEHLRPELRDALQVICAEKITARRLGYWLRANRDRIVDGMRVHHCGDDPRTKVARWAIVT